MKVTPKMIQDLPTFASNFFTIRTKSGQPELFKFNQAQLYIHQKLQDQLEKIGRVRAIILKGRQQGCSTYIQSRYFHQIITTKGKKAFILTHESEATKNLFEMTKRFYEKLPPGLCPQAEKSSAKELQFLDFDSGYSVGTAGNRATGRGQTVQLMHASEVAFWEHAEDHAKGVLQAISNMNGTEIIFESTANGIGNYFHQIWQSAEERLSEYQNIFIPWYWQQEYTFNDKNLRLTEEEEYLLSIYSEDGLTKPHLAWRRIKISEFSNDYDVGLERFKQEYPMNAQEAFLNPIENVFINSKHVVKARNANVDSTTRLIIGVDVAIGDNDKTAIIRRRGRVAYNLETFRNLNTMEIAGLLKHIIDKEKPYRVYIDCIGIGAGVVDRLREQGYDMVEGINVARSANYKDKYKNLRAEIWAEMKDWLMQDMSVQIPDDDILHGDLCNLGYKYDSSGRLQIESKDDLKARGMPSPDTADALALTFFSGKYDTTEDFAVTKIMQARPDMFF